MADRLFVLQPLADLAPRLVPPGWGETVATAAARRRAIEGADAVVAIDGWPEPGLIEIVRLATSHGRSARARELLEGLDEL
jgi:hypothetical protein